MASYLARGAKSLRRAVTSLLGRAPRAAVATVADRFAHFRAIGAANDAFLEKLSCLQERSSVPGSRPTMSTAQVLSSHVGVMVQSLLAMKPGRYDALLRRYQDLDAEISIPTNRKFPDHAGPLIIWPDEADAIEPALVGPKAARLAKVARSGGPQVPPFFSVSVFGYRLFMASSGIRDLVNEALSSLDFHDTPALKGFSEAIIRSVEKAELPADLEEQLQNAYRDLTVSVGRPVRVAVRSSALVEDTESSFAGQFESVLNVGSGELVRAYKQVVASKYRYPALKYAMARGFLEEDIAMPVLVMEMVQPSASGVAYSRCPDRSDRAMVTAVPGLAQIIVDGRIVPDTFLIPASAPDRVEETKPGKWSHCLRCAEDGGVVETGNGPRSDGESAVTEEIACSVARTALALEHQFDAPQDVEWAQDEGGSIFVVQTRPLSTSEPPASRLTTEVGGYRILARGVRASGGVACGPVFRLLDPQAIETVPEDVILCLPNPSPRLAAVMWTVRGIVAATGSPTGHMATVAREFNIPCLVGAENALLLTEATIITVDGDAGIVYEGEVPELLREANRPNAGPRPPIPPRDALQPILQKIAPLTLEEPDSPAFTPGNCRTLHDVARYVHQKSMQEMFELEDLSAREKRGARRLLWRVPMEVLLVDLGGGLETGAERNVPIDKVRSTPLLALIDGMTDPRLRWAGPVGFDLKGFMSVVVRSAADDQRYGEPNYCLCAQDYVHFASRLAYHFATVDAICGPRINENYARFLFFGGAAIAERREFRAHFLATVLQSNEFAVKQSGDRVEALLTKRSGEQLEETLVMLGRLMVASRHLDMMMESPAVARTFAVAFLSGDYSFERVGKRGE